MPNYPITITAMDKKCFDSVWVYHDETSSSEFKFKGHVLLFVPCIKTIMDSTPLFGEYKDISYPSSELSPKIIEIREKYGLQDRKLHFTDISGQHWTKYDIGMRKIVGLVVDSLRSKRSEFFRQALGCKVAVLFYPSSKNTVRFGGHFGGERDLRYDETMLRILLKGACHFLYDEQNIVELSELITDGLPCHRPLDNWRIVNKLKMEGSYGRTELRDYVSTSPELKIKSLDSDHKNHERESIDYIHANFLQLADMLLGSLIQSCYKGIRDWIRIPPQGQRDIPKKEAIAYPVKAMMDKMARRSGFKHSGHFRSFSISQLIFEGETITFRELEPKQLEIKDGGQLSLFANETNEI